MSLYFYLLLVSFLVILHFPEKKQTNISDMSQTFTFSCFCFPHDFQQTKIQTYIKTNKTLKICLKLLLLYLLSS
jgi:hypothetical protein